MVSTSCRKLTGLECSLVREVICRSQIPVLLVGWGSAREDRALLPEARCLSTHNLRQMSSPIDSETASLLCNTAEIQKNRTIADDDCKIATATVEGCLLPGICSCTRSIIRGPASCQGLSRPATLPDTNQSIKDSSFDSSRKCGGWDTNINPHSLVETCTTYTALQIIGCASCLDHDHADYSPSLTGISQDHFLNNRGLYCNKRILPTGWPPGAESACLFSETHTLY